MYLLPTHSFLHLAARPCSTLQTPTLSSPGHHGHTRPRGPCPPRTPQLLGLQAAPASSPALAHFDKSRKRGVSLDRLLLSHPVLGEWGQSTSGQPRPTPKYVLCTTSSQRVWGGRGESDCRVEDPMIKVISTAINHIASRHP